MPISIDEENTARLASSLRARASRLILLIFLGQLLVSFFIALFSDKTDRFEIVAQILIWGLIIAVGYSLAVFFSPRMDLRPILTVVLLSLNLYVALNLVLYALGVEIFKPILPISDNTATMLAIIGIRIDRVFFPLATGINTFGLIAGASFVVAILNMCDDNYSRWQRYMAAIFGIISTIALFLSDSRLAFVGAVLVSVLLLVLPTQKVRYLRFLPIFSPIFPVVLLLVLRMMLSTSLANGMARNSSDMLTLNSRTIYWQASIERLAHFSPQHLLGYGFYGHRSSGLVSDMLAVLPPVADSNRLHSHNALLQGWIDTGYLGVLVYIGLFVSLIQRAEELWRKGRGRAPMACLGFIIYLLFMGTTESIPTAYSQVIFAVFLLLSFLLLWAPDSMEEDLP